MTGLNHAMGGAVIALVVKQPVLAIPLAFISHFAQDLIPHFGLDENKVFSRTFNIILISDFLFSVALMVVLALLFPAHKWLIWACMIAAASPDLMWAYYRLYIERYRKRAVELGPVARFHSRIQWSQTVPGAAIEALWFLITGAAILSLR